MEVEAFFSALFVSRSFFPQFRVLYGVFQARSLIDSLGFGFLGSVRVGADLSWWIWFESLRILEQVLLVGL